MDILTEINRLVESSGMQVIDIKAENDVITLECNNGEPLYRPLKIIPNGDGSFFVRDTQVDNGFQRQTYVDLARWSGSEPCSQDIALHRVGEWLAGLQAKRLKR